MCAGVSLSHEEVPLDLIDRYELWERMIVRVEAVDWELRFLFRDPLPVLPVLPVRYQGQLLVYPWGNPNGLGALPRTGWVKQEELASGLWQALQPEPVEIPATFGCDSSIWFPILGGVRGVLVRDEEECPHVYMLTETASTYYSRMTYQQRMPVLIGR